MREICVKISDEVGEDDKEEDDKDEHIWTQWVACGSFDMSHYILLKKK